LLAGVALGADARVVRAFCRETVESQPSGPCVEPEGVPRLIWKRSCLSYVFNDQLFARMPMLSEAEVRSIFEMSFATWRSVKCAGSSDAFFVAQAAGTTSSASVELLRDEPNESIVVARTRDEWLARDHAEDVVALTSLWSDKKTGEILDVDMEINGRFAFGNCDTTSCALGVLDLQNSITHEAGHVLGLGHSPDAENTMFGDTPPFGETDKRSLAADDIAGYCALELPKAECKGAACKCPAPPVLSTLTRSSSCAVSGSLASHARPSGVFALVALAASRRSRLWRGRGGPSARPVGRD
jgi:hypothetical protein